MAQKCATPMNQRRHTNIAVIKVNKGGKKVEIACYKNKVVAYRNGLLNEGESTDDVLQVERVFSDVGKGQYASKTLLEEVLGAEFTNEKKALKYILDHGQLQVTQAERTAESEEMLKEICTVISEKCVNSTTGRPYPVSLILSTLKQLQFAVKLEHAVKKQALGAIHQLIEQQPLPIRRAPMLIRCSVAGAAAVAGGGGKKQKQPVYFDGDDESELNSPNAEKDSPLPKVVSENPLEDAKAWAMAQQGISLHTDPTLALRDTFLVMIDPGLFRSLDTHMREVGGAVQVLQATVMVTSVGDADDFDTEGAEKQADVSLPVPMKKVEANASSGGKKGRKTHSKVDADDESAVAASKSAEEKKAEEKKKRKAKKDEKKKAELAAQAKEATPENSDDDVVGGKKGKKQKSREEKGAQDKGVPNNYYDDDDEAWMNGEDSD